MRKLVVSEFLTLDGVMQAPGGADEDTEGKRRQILTVSLLVLGQRTRVSSSKDSARRLPQNLSVEP